MAKALNLTKADLLEFEAEKKRNFKQRLEFVRMYAEWLKKTPNKAWSKHQNQMTSRTR